MRVDTKRPQGRQDRNRKQSSRNTSSIPPISPAATPRPAPVTPLAYTVQQAMEALSISYYSIRLLIRTGELKSIAVGGGTRRAGRRIIPVAAIEAYLNRELAAQSGEGGGRDGAA